MMIPTNDTPLNIFVGSMVVDFPVDNVSISISEDNWKLWASFLVQENSFANNGAPNPSGFENKTQWAQAVFHSMASFS